MRCLILEFLLKNIEKNMINGTNNESKWYKFRGKVFECSESIIRQLNLALAYNRAKERYEEVKPNTTRKS
jgi:hypothetical protein